MRLLLDTHALIWFSLGDTKLPQKARDAITDPDNEVFVSAASAWELATKHRLEKLPNAEFLVQNFHTIVANAKFTELPISVKHAFLAGSLKMEHKDPFDRMIIAQGLLESLTIVTNEELFETMSIIRLWA